MTGMITCARPGCSVEFEPKNVRSKYHSRECANNGSRDDKRSAARQKLCRVWFCRKPFTASDVRQDMCPECVTTAVLTWDGDIAVRDENVGALETRESRRIQFVSVDGEGYPCDCRQCDCKLFKPGQDTELCECGHGVNAVQGDVNTGHVHRYVLLGCGDEQIERQHRDLGWEEIFEFLYAEFGKYDPSHTAFVGFYLGYDFTQWFKTLPESKAWQLLSKEGQDKRKAQRMQHTKQKNPVPYPVKVSGTRGSWEIDIHADRRFKLRPKICDCPDDTHASKEERGGKACPVVPYMYICDVGGFFQTAFLNVANPDKWQDDQPCTQADYDDISQGKKRRSTAILDDEMRHYNRLENAVLSEVMARYRDGLERAKVTLDKGEWYGPGQAAQKWLMHAGAPTREQIETAAGSKVLDAARQTYYGGWFEIMAHGTVPGKSYEYDINSAYPHIISELPCLLHGTWISRKPRTAAGLPAGSELRLVQAAVYGSDPHIGTMLHRTLDNSILRPTATRGWFWQHELEAAIRAGLIDRVECYESHTYQPCNCPPPLRGMIGLYEGRLKVGKDSAHGKAFKLVYNSAYGKFAQSIGAPKYANPIYASLITAGCRTMILDAIATHPQQSKAVVMVATDGVYFTSPHPNLPVSKKLGEWDMTEKSNLTLFKPGVYWDDSAREQIKSGKAPVFKARGVSATEFAKVIGDIDDWFARWDGRYPEKSKDWPSASFALSFSMISAKQALRRKWGLAGHVSDVNVTHHSEPSGKRSGGWFDETLGEFVRPAGTRDNGVCDAGIYRSKPHVLICDSEGMPQKSVAYNKSFGSTALMEAGKLDPNQYGITPDGAVRDLWYQGMGIG